MATIAMRRGLHARNDLNYYVEQYDKSRKQKAFYKVKKLLNTGVFDFIID